MSDTPTLIELESRLCAPNYSPLPVVLSHGQGVFAFDIAGKKYLDMMSAYSALSHGYAHPRLLQALQHQAQKLAICSRAFYSETLGAFLEQLCKLTGLEMALPMNTGAEAVETAIKAARRWGYQHKNIAKDQAEIIVASGNFHGRTTTIISFSSEPSYKADFGPLTPGFVTVPFGDSHALQQAITPNTCAVLLEPIQGEAGIIVPPAGYLKAAEAACKANNVLLMLDEIQSGLGRTGKLFAYEHEAVQPDCVILGKALGGGLLPVSAVVAKRSVLSLLTPGSHGSTFGGNPLAAAVGLEALQIIQDDHYAQRSQALGAYFKHALEQIQSPAIRAIRGKGLWIGLEVDPKIISGKALALQCLKAGMLTKETHSTTLRLAPPLIIEQSEIDLAVSILQQLLS